jgi:flavin-dependent dehydrogenase
MHDADVIVVGGGPAGASCAWMLRRHGVETILLDRAEFPRGKLCAGWVTPRVFRDLEVEPAEYPHGLLTFDRLSFHLRGRRFDLPTRQFSIRRYEFDQWLLERAGVPTFRHAVREIVQADGRYVLDGQYRARHLVGAGGTHCPVYRSLFERLNPRAESALIATMEEELPYRWTDGRCRLWFFDEGLPGYSWYVPKAGGYVNIGVGGRLRSLRRGNQSIRAHWQLLVARLHALELVTEHDFRPRGHFYYLRNRVSRVRDGNALLVGDAAGLATLDMGEGIGPAIESGLRAARSILRGEPYSLRSVSRFSAPRLLFPGR